MTVCVAVCVTVCVYLCMKEKRRKRGERSKGKREDSEYVKANDERDETHICVSV